MTEAIKQFLGLKVRGKACCDPLVRYKVHQADTFRIVAEAKPVFGRMLLALPEPKLVHFKSYGPGDVVLMFQVPSDLRRNTMFRWEFWYRFHIWRTLWQGDQGGEYRGYVIPRGVVPFIKADWPGFRSLAQEQIRSSKWSKLSYHQPWLGKGGCGLDQRRGPCPMAMLELYRPFKSAVWQTAKAERLKRYGCSSRFSGRIFGQRLSEYLGVPSRSLFNASLKTRNDVEREKAVFFFHFSSRKVGIYPIRAISSPTGLSHRLMIHVHRGQVFQLFGSSGQEVKAGGSNCRVNIARYHIALIEVP